jgi:ubiquinone/menaquinone biosynthesis C-methylase UbiE
MLRSAVSSVLRKSGLLFYTDQLRYQIEKLRHSGKNQAFKKQNSEINLPPDYLIYESFRLDYDKYYNGGKDTAIWLIEHFKKYIDLKNKNILDWGCGPGRTIRHFPELLDASCKIFGTDYNKRSIAWCSENIKQVDFNHNDLKANLPYQDNSMDIIYGISIFTHLSEKAHHEWFQELYRILTPDGIMLLSLQGDNFKVKLTEEELNQYTEGKLVVRGKVKEGHRTYSAFHPNAFVHNLFQKVDILEQIIENPTKNSAIPQDIWIIRKPK